MAARTSVRTINKQPGDFRVSPEKYYLVLTSVLVTVSFFSSVLVI